MTDEQKGQEVVEEVVPASENQGGELPEDASERTRKEFEKLKAHNKELQEKLKAQEEEKKKPSILEEMYPGSQPERIEATPMVSANQFQNLNQQQVNQIQDDFTYVGEDGYKYIDPVKLKNALKEADERARKAEKASEQVFDKIRRYEETQQVRDAYKEFPELNPNKKDSFDENFYELVKGELMNQAMRGEKDLVKAAKTVKQRLGSYTGKATQQQVAKETKVQKEQINATGSVQKRSSYTGADINDLVAGTRYGKPGALAERLRRSGY